MAMQPHEPEKTESQEQKKITKEYLDGLQKSHALFQRFLGELMHSSEEKLLGFQQKAIELGKLMGIEYRGVNSIDENMVFGKLKITGKTLSDDGYRYNIALLDDEGDLIKSSFKQSLTETEVLAKIQENGSKEAR